MSSTLEKQHRNQGIRLLRRLFLDGKRIFNMSDAIMAAKAEKVAPNQLRKILSILAKQGKILRLRRGLYAGIGLLPEETQPPTWAISTHLIQPSAISHWSALQHHGLTEQISQVVTASTPRKVVTPSMRGKKTALRETKHTLLINDVRYEYITVQKKHFFGIEKIWLDEHFQIPITDKERTLLDVFVYPKMFGGIGEALAILENSLAVVDIKKLIDYTIRYDKKSIAKRLGWALEYFGVSSQKLQPLLKVPMDYYCRLDPSTPSRGKYNKRWMIQNNLIK